MLLPDALDFCEVILGNHSMQPVCVWDSEIHCSGKCNRNDVRQNTIENVKPLPCVSEHWQYQLNHLQNGLLPLSGIWSHKVTGYCLYPLYCVGLSKFLISISKCTSCLFCFDFCFFVFCFNFKINLLPKAKYAAL